MVVVIGSVLMAGYFVCVIGGVFQALFMEPVAPRKINEIEAVMFGWKSGGRCK